MKKCQLYFKKIFSKKYKKVPQLISFYLKMFFIDSADSIKYSVDLWARL